MRVDEVMTRDVTVVSPSTSLKDAAAVVLAQGVSGLPVVDEGRVVGVLSESDIVGKETSGYRNGDTDERTARHLRHEREARTVADAMTRELVTVEAWESVWAAADLMALHGVNRLPVVDADGMLLGIVARADLVRAFARSDGDIEREIRGRLLPSVGLAAVDPLEVNVDHGVVTVRGTMDSEASRECLYRTLHLVPGVVGVEWEVAAPRGGVPEPVRGVD